MYIELATNICLGLGFILATFLLHAFALDGMMRILSPFIQKSRAKRNDKVHFWPVLTLLITATGIIFIHSAEIWMWAFLYVYLPISSIPDFETALYFSAVSSSTVGYGDVVLSSHYRILGSMEAASGMILFGWSTAFLFEVLALTYARMNFRKMNESEE